MKSVSAAGSSLKRKRHYSSKSIKMAKTISDYGQTEACDDSYPSKSRKQKPKKKEKLKATKQRLDAQSGYVFVVKVNTNEGKVWNFVDFSYGTTLRVSSTITALMPKITSEMQELWKRIVIDDVFSWDTSEVDSKTLRLVRVTLGCEDASLGLFADADDMREKFKLAALSRLTSEEAKLINVDKKHTVLQLMRDPVLDQRDSDLADRMRDDMTTELVEQIFKMEV
jgi:hypothetical protein